MICFSVEKNEFDNPEIIRIDNILKDVLEDCKDFFSHFRV